MSDTDMAPRAFAAACRRRDDARIVHQSWCAENNPKLKDRPADLANGWRSYALQKAWDWSLLNPDTRPLFDITEQERALFRKQWISQTRRLRYGPIEGLTEAEWRGQMATIEAEYWPKRREAA
jgi:hypothetical protein